MVYNLAKKLWHISNAIYKRLAYPFLYCKKGVALKSKFNIARKTSTFSYILFGMPTYGNLGDHGIGYAQKKFFNDYFSNISKIYITDNEWVLRKDLIKKLVSNNDKIIIIGGGFIGTLWMEGAELAVRDYIQSFANNKIIIFPQTVYFEKSDYGLKELNNTKKIWQNHKDLTVCLREKTSFDFVNANMKNNNFDKIELIPDIV